MIYRVYVNSIKFFDTEIDELALINPIVTLELNKAGSFTFSVPASHPYIDKIEALTSIVSVFYLYPGYTTEHFLFCGACTKVVESMFGDKQIECEGILALYNRLYHSGMLKFDMTQKTVENLFDTFRIVSGVKVGSNTVSILKGSCNVTNTQGVTEIKYDNYPTKLEALMGLVGKFGGSINISFNSITRNPIANTAGYSFNINYVRNTFIDSIQELIFGENLISLDVDIDEPNLFNTIIPIGAKVSDYSRYIGTKSKAQALITKYGVIEKSVTWDDQTNATTLTNLGRQYMEDNLYKTITAKAKFLDLSNTSDTIAPIVIDRKVHVYSPKQGIDREMNVIARTYNLLSPGNDTLTLSATEQYVIS